MQAIGGFLYRWHTGVDHRKLHRLLLFNTKKLASTLSERGSKNLGKPNPTNQKSHRLESSPSSISNADRPGDEPELPTTRSVFRLALPLDFTRKSQPGESPPP
jgi:hypothetical protein